MTTTTQKMTKTEKAIIDRLAVKIAAYGDTATVTVEWVYGVGPEGGYITHGSRHYDAAYALVRRGILSVANSSRTVNRGLTNCVVVVRMAK